MIILVIYITTIVVCIVSFNFGGVRALSEYYKDTNKSSISLSIVKMEPVNIRESKNCVYFFLFLTFRFGEYVIHYFK